MKPKKLQSIVMMVAAMLFISSALLTIEVIRQTEVIEKLTEEKIILEDASDNMAYYIEMLQMELEAERQK